ncbi:MAG: diguanylate cyclase [Rhodocyclaceae bacterium]
MTISLPLRINLISLVFAALVATVLTVIGGAFIYQQQRQNAIARAQIASDELASRAERLLGMQLRYEDFLGFDEQCSAVIRSDPLLSESALFNERGIQQYRSNAGGIAWPIGESLPEPGSTRTLYTNTGVIVVHPVVLGKDNVRGYTIVAINGETLLRETFRPIGWLVLSGMALFIVGLVIQQGIFWRAVGRPLARLVRTADELRPGDPAQIVALQQLTEKDDIGRVYAALARLMQRLADARNELVAQNTQLEAAVRERTEQLERANSELALDIERRKELEDELRTLASTDSLTGLSNRSFIMPYLERRLEQARRNYSPLGVVILDFDGFKNINDTYGHAVGDQALQIMGRRIEQVCRQSDVLARLGGDEFLIAFEAFLDDTQAEALCRRIIMLFEQPLQINSLSLKLGVSIGVAMFPRNGGDLVALLSAADRAMYQAKSEGGGFHFAPASHSPTPHVSNHASL